MNNIHDLQKIKRAKIIVRELEQVLKIINLSIQGLKPYKKYTTLSETLLCLRDSKDILEIHLSHNKKILENKGKTIEES